MMPTESGTMPRIEAMHPTATRHVLVTGASGFIGRRLVRRLIDRRGQVSCVVRSRSRIDAARWAGAELLSGDVTDRASVERALARSRPSAVVHLAGCVNALRRDDFTRVNAAGVENVAAACADRAEPPILVVVSSLAVAGPCTADRVCVEEDVPAPVSAYGRSKLAGEHAAVRHAGTVPITIVRPPIVFGSGDRGVLEMFRPIARWGVHLVPGRHEHRFSLVHVDDLVEGLLLAAESGERLLEHAPHGQGVYFIAGDEHPTLAQLGLSMAAALQQEPPTVVHLPRTIVRLAGVGGDVIAQIGGRSTWINSDKVAEALAGSWTCSSAKACAHLGWAPAATLADRLRETARWYREAGWL